MPYPVQNLLQGRGAPVTVRAEQPATEAIAIMIEMEYSQLPVIDGERRPVGVITFQSIVEATSSLGVAVKDLTVGHAAVRADEFSPDDDLFDVIDRLQDKYSVLIIDPDGKLMGIVTTYDSTEYFRRRGEDLMLVEDIEGMLKDMILAAYGVQENSGTWVLEANKEDGVAVSADNEQLAAAIQRISDNQGQLMGQYRDALKIYLAESGLAGKSNKLDQAALDASFARLAPVRGPRSFDSLTFYDYVELFLHERTWQHYGPTLQLDRSAVRQLLEGVRSTRNHLAHFRNELSAMERSQLRFCWNWLQKHQPQPPPAAVLWTVDQIAYVPPGTTLSGSLEHDGAPQYYEQATGNNGSKYVLLATYFQNQPAHLDRINLRFDEIERIVHAPLPASARTHRGWWTNNAVTISRMQRWLDAGWRVASVNLAEQVATFERIPERQRRLIQFFVQLQGDLKDRMELPESVNPPKGEAWHVLAPVSAPGGEGMYYIAAFAPDNHFRLELYIDTGIRERNNLIFDWLVTRRQAVEQELGAQLSWERMDDRRAARVAWVHNGSIADSDEELAQLRTWAAEAATHFAAVLEPIATAAAEQATHTATAPAN
jgi:hypothetical protein